MKIKKVKEIVIDLLERYPVLRDSDDRLVANVWGSETKQITSRQGFLQTLADESLTSYQSISRCRRKLQEQQPELRGKNYKARQAEQEPVKKEIRDW